MVRTTLCEGKKEIYPLPLEWSMHEAQQVSRAFHLPSHCAVLQMLIEQYPSTDVTHA